MILDCRWFESSVGSRVLVSFFNGKELSASWRNPKGKLYRWTNKAVNKKFIDWFFNDNN